MKSILFIGPPGSGKTSLIRSLCAAGIFPRSVAILNDDGQGTPVDAHMLAGVTDLRTMTGGCFTCKDEAGFHALLKALQDSGEFDWLLLEPLGFVKGSEPVESLYKAGLAPHVLGLLNVQALNDYQAELGPVLASQIQAATVAVGLTHIKGASQQQIEAAEEFIGKVAPGMSVFQLLEGGLLPEWVSEAMHGEAVSVTSCDHEHHNPGCKHEHHHDHDHGHRMYTFGVKPGVGHSIVMSLFDAYPGPIARVKGVIGGVRIDRSTRNSGWAEPKPQSQTDSKVTFYATEEVDTAFFADIIDPASDPYRDLDTRALLRMGIVPVEQSVAVINRLLSRFPTSVVMTPQGPITNLEVMEIVNQIRKRPGIPADVDALAIRARVEYYLKVVAVLTPDSPWWNGPDAVEAARRKLDLAMGIGWFAYNKPTELGVEIMDRIRAVDLDTMLAGGVAQYPESQFRYNPGSDDRR